MTFDWEVTRKTDDGRKLETQLGIKPAWTRDPETGSDGAQAQAHHLANG